MPRKRYTKPDENHGIVRDWLIAVAGAHPVTKAPPHAYRGSWRGFSVFAVDMKDVGGVVLDWYVWLGPYLIVLEVKPPGQHDRLTTGERLFMDKSAARVAVVTNLEEVVDAMARHFFWATGSFHPTP